MKTAVSIPDDLFKQVDKLAKKAGKSRSKIYAEALENLLQRQKDDEITRKLNKIAAEVDTSLDPALAELSRQTLLRNEW